MAITTWDSLSPSSTYESLGREALLSGSPIYANSDTGDDGNAGTNPALPLLTFAAAVTAAVDNGTSIIVLQSGFTETLVAKVTISNAKTGLWIIGEGTGSAKAILRNNVGAASTDCIYISSGEAIRLQNINFAVTTLGAPAANTIAAFHGTSVIDCDFGINSYSGVSFESSGGDYQLVKGCTFVGRGSLAGTEVGLAVSGGKGILVEDCTFDGNGYGKLIGLSDSGSTATRVVGATLANNAHMVFATGSTGQVDFAHRDRGCSIVWVP